MLRRIDLVMSACQHGDGAGIERDTMRGLIDAARQSGGDRKARAAEIARNGLREFQSCAGCVAGADDADHRLRLDIQDAAHTEQRRRVVDQGEARRVPIFPRSKQGDADPFAVFDLAFGFGLRADAANLGSSAALGEIGQALECGACTAEMIDEGAKGTRSDIVGTDQPQPVDALRVGQSGRG